MKLTVSATFAATATIILLCFILGFHFFILFGVIPYDMVWGGRLTSKEEMMQFELVSIIINSFILIVVYQRGFGKIRFFPPRILQILMWVIFILYVLNTLGNFFSISSIETYIFTPVTILLSYFCFVLATKKQDNQ